MNRKPAGIAKASFIFSAWHDPAARIFNVDILAVAIAIFLPWSTTGVVVFVTLWAVALMWTLDLRSFSHLLARSACLTPVALFLLACLGMLWSNATWQAGLDAVSPTVKLLVLPLLLYHFSRSTRGVWTLAAFLASSSLLMLASWVVAFIPELTLKPYIEPGIVVKNHIDQSHVFVLCAVLLGWPISVLYRSKRFLAAGLLTLVLFGFIANMAFINISRTALITLPIMLAAASLHRLSWRSVAGVLGAVAILGGLSWSASPVLRAKTASLFPPYRLYEPANEPTSIEMRQEYWRKSFAFVREAPLFGHGTGSTGLLFERAALNQTGIAAEVTSNPHNQTLNMAVQWGVIGVLALYAMWLSHLALFRGESWAGSIGFLVVVQNIVSSMFNSHLFDFQEGWIYVLGVGVTGGIVLAERRSRGEPKTGKSIFG